MSREVTYVYTASQHAADDVVAIGETVFCHGEGGRCCMKQAAKGELLNQIEEAEIEVLNVP